MSELLAGKLIGQLLLPPGCIIVLAVVGLLAGRRWWGRVLLVGSLAALWLLSTGAVKDALLAALEHAEPPLDAVAVEQLRESPGHTAIVLLGGGTRENAPEYGGADDLPAIAMLRTLYAAELAQKTGLPVYATGGRVLSMSDESEGAIMLRRLMQFGVSAESAFAEQASQNTWQNAVYMQRMLSDRGIKQVVLVTSAWHMPRALWCFEQQRMKVIPAPMHYLGLQRPMDARGLFPDAGALADSSLALHEYIGLAWYRLRYGHDWSIRWLWS